MLSHPGGGCLWLPVPGDDYPALREYLDPALRRARSSPVIELFRAGELVNQYWYKEWETQLLEQEEDAEERLFLQPHLGVHTMTPELAASRGRLEFRIGARRVMEQDTESWLGLRAERIAVFRRKLRQGGCRYRDIASVETVHAMVADGYTHIRSVPLPARDDPGDKLERLAWAKEQLSNVTELMTSYPDGYELRFVPSDRIPASRLWSLVRKPGQQADVLFTFTLTGQASGQVASPGGRGRGSPTRSSATPKCPSGSGKNSSSYGTKLPAATTPFTSSSKASTRSAPSPDGVSCGNPGIVRRHGSSGVTIRSDVSRAETTLAQAGRLPGVRSEIPYRTLPGVAYSLPARRRGQL